MKNEKRGDHASEVSDKIQDKFYAFSRVAILYRTNEEENGCKRLNTFLEKELGDNNWCVIGKSTESRRGALEHVTYDFLCLSALVLTLKWADIRDGCLRVVDHRIIHEGEMVCMPEDIQRWISLKSDQSSSYVCGHV